MARVKNNNFATTPLCSLNSKESQRAISFTAELGMNENEPRWMEDRGEKK